MANGNGSNGNGSNGSNGSNGNTTAVPTVTLAYRKQHPGGGALGRCSYGIAGVPGIVVFDMGMFAPAQLAANGGLPPATLTVVGMAAAAPTVRKAAGVTSAVVAGANTAAAAAAQGSTIATPAHVAHVAGVAGAAVVAAAAASKPAAAAAAAAVQGKAARTA